MNKILTICVEIKSEKFNFTDNDIEISHECISCIHLLFVLLLCNLHLNFALFKSNPQSFFPSFEIARLQATKKMLKW